MIVVGSVVLVGLPAAPAAAHGGGPDAAYYRTQFTEVVAQPPGVAARVDPAGEWIELTYTGSGTVIVLGYLREPYLRVTAGGVEENLLSQTTYLNQAMFADISIGAAVAAAAPSWHSIGRSGTARWHDHRIHWRGQARPAVSGTSTRPPDRRRSRSGGRSPGGAGREAFRRRRGWSWGWSTSRCSPGCWR
jgi:hypothetical protein